MRRSYYIFSSGKLMRKQNTLFFLPYDEEEALLEEIGHTEEEGNTRSPLWVTHTPF